LLLLPAGPPRRAFYWRSTEESLVTQQIGVSGRDWFAQHCCIFVIPNPANSLLEARWV